MEDHADRGAFGVDWVGCEKQHVKAVRNGCTCYLWPAVARSHDDNTIRYVLPVLWMTYDMMDYINVRPKADE